MRPMRLMTRTLFILLTVLALSLAACSGDGDDSGGVGPTPSVGASPAPTSPATGDQSPIESPGDTSAPPGETAAPVGATPTPAVAEQPPAPTLEEGVTRIGEGVITFALVPNGQFLINGLGLLQPGTEAPSCDAFRFAFAWNSAPGDGSVTWELINGDVRQEVAAGATGSATVGCGQLMAENRGTETLTVSVRYIQGRAGG